jgi:hypothetical protein
MSQWSRATVNIDYHIAFDWNFYSVPYKLVQQEVEVRSTPHHGGDLSPGEPDRFPPARSTGAVMWSLRMSTVPKAIRPICNGRPRGW